MNELTYKTKRDKLREQIYSCRGEDQGKGHSMVSALGKSREKEAQSLLYSFTPQNTEVFLAGTLLKAMGCSGVQ